MRDKISVRQLTALVLALSLLLASCGGGAKATTMHLRKTEGTVGVSDGEKAVEPKENLGLYSGYVVDTLRGAFMLLERAESYEEAVRGAVALGDDTDTTACVAGGLAGVRFGAGGIPRRWMETLRGRACVEELIARVWS